MPYKDPEKQRAAQHASYQRNKQVIVERTRQQRLKRRRLVNEVKMAKGCQRCGYSKHPVALDAHHPDSDKDGAVSTMIMNCVNIDTILEELAKCEIICANCHREHHFTNHTIGKNKASIV